MESNNVYENIVKLGGNCFADDERPLCRMCPFQAQCLYVMISEATSISRETRLRWALDALVEEHLLDSNG